MKKISLALITAAPLVLGGLALAQQATPNVQTSTPGAGCTATGNAMRSGNLGGGPSSTACAGNARTAAAAPGSTGTGSANSVSSGGPTGHSDAMAGSEPTHVARAPRADRN